jgi:hypothetical protein
MTSIFGHERYLPRVPIAKTATTTDSARICPPTPVPWNKLTTKVVRGSVAPLSEFGLNTRTSLWNSDSSSGEKKVTVARGEGARGRSEGTE